MIIPRNLLNSTMSILLPSINISGICVKDFVLDLNILLVFIMFKDSLFNLNQRANGSSAYGSNVVAVEWPLIS